MDLLDRRRFLVSLTAGAAGMLAGCSDGNGGDGTGTPTATPPPESAAVTEESVVDYPGFVDGAATVVEAENQVSIRYTEPVREFGLEAGFQGESDPEELRVTRGLSVDTRAGFVAPVYDGDAGAFVYRVFANEAFVEFTDWNAVTVGTGETLSSEGAVEFERLQGPVFGARLAPGELSRLFVVDSTAEELADGGAGNLSGLVLLVRDRSDGVPEVTFSFEYDRSAGELTITHDGGDTITRGEELAVLSGDLEESWTTPVAAGDTRTVTVEPDATVSIVWLGTDGASKTLDRWIGPEA